jgi:hypothetical protein
MATPGARVKTVRSGKKEKHMKHLFPTPPKGHFI